MNIEPVERWGRISANLYRVEEPDICFVRFYGTLLGPEMARIFEEIRRFADGRRRAFWLADLSAMETTLDARKVARTGLPQLRLDGLAIFSTNPRDRILSALVVKAIKIVVPSATLPPIANFDTELDARAWIQQRREELNLAEASQRRAGS